MHLLGDNHPEWRFVLPQAAAWGASDGWRPVDVCPREREGKVTGWAALSPGPRLPPDISSLLSPSSLRSSAGAIRSLPLAGFP